MSALLAIAGQTPPSDDVFEPIHRVAPGPQFYAGLIFVGTVVLYYWWQVRKHFSKDESE